MDTTRVFVYGTLRPGQPNDIIALRHGPREIVPATLRGYPMHTLGAFPGLIDLGVRDHRHEVRGDVYVYDGNAGREALASMDGLEGVNRHHPERGMYRREWVTLTDGTEAWVYIYNREPRGPRIASGDWTTVSRPMPF